MVFLKTWLDDLRARTLKDKRTVVWLVFGLVILCGVWSRSYDLFKYDLWHDELVTERYSYSTLTRQSIQSNESRFHIFFRRIRGDYQSLLYYLSAVFYTYLFPQEKALRVFSLFFSVLSLFVFYRVARRYLGTGASLGALVIMVGSSFQIWYAQEERSYAMGCFFFLWAVHSWLRVRERAELDRWVVFFIAALLSFLSSYYALFLFLFMVTDVVKKQRPCVNVRWLGAAVLFGISLMGGATVISQQVHRFSTTPFWLYAPAWRTLFFSPFIFLAGYGFDEGYLMVGSAVVWGLLARALFVYFKEDPHKAVSLFILSILPLLLTFLLSFVWKPCYIDRQLIVFTPFIYILVTRGVQSIRDIAVRTLVVVLVGVSLWVGTRHLYNGHVGQAVWPVYQGVNSRKQYMSLLELVRSEIRTGDVVMVADLQSGMAAEKYLLPDLQKPSQLTFIYNDKVLAPHHKTWHNFKLILSDHFDTADEGLFAFDFIDGLHIPRREYEGRIKGDRIWLMTSSWGSQADLIHANARFVLDMLRQQFQEVKSESSSGVTVRLFIKK